MSFLTNCHNYQMSPTNPNGMTFISYHYRFLSSTDRASFFFSISADSAVASLSIINIISLLGEVGAFVAPGVFRSFRQICDFK